MDGWRAEAAEIKRWLARHKRFVLFAAVALLVYALGAQFLLLPAVRLPPSLDSARLPAAACSDAAFLEEVQAQQTILFVPLADVPEQLVQSLLQQEDASFYRHGGVNWVQVGFAFLKDLDAGRYQYGASTITMQLMRELFLVKERSLVRKLREVSYALQAERLLAKSSILELYLNVIHWGPGIRGVGAASCYYFGVRPTALSSSDAARLVSVLPNPDRYGPALRAAVANRPAGSGAAGSPRDEAP